MITKIAPRQPTIKDPIKNLVNLGDAKTLVVHPHSTIYRDFSPEQAEEAGVYTDLIRVSVGLEHSDDIKSDLDQALAG